MGIGIRVGRIGWARAAVCALTVPLLPAAGGEIRAPQVPAADKASALPVGLVAAASATLGARRSEFAVVPRRGSLFARGGGLETSFASTGPSVRVEDARLSLRLTAVGRKDRLTRVGAAVPRATGNRVSYRHGALEEWYVNGPFGLEQGFTLARRTPGAGPLTLAVRSAGALRPRQSGPEIVFGAAGRTVTARYGGLFAVDAAGTELPTRLELDGSTILLRVDDTRARYPLTVDPFIQQGTKLTGGGEIGNGRFGASITLSADGNIALVGAPDDDGLKGAVWIFTRSGTVWSQQGGKLTGSGETGNGRFGNSVSLSSDGNTALIGGYEDAGAKGAAWVFTRSGTAWSQQGAKLTGSGETGNGRFGSSVSLSGDGSTALIGGYYDDKTKGAAWIFTRSGSTWTQQGPKLTGAGATGDPLFGVTTAISSDGNTALIGGFVDASYKGAAWVFVRTGSTWAQQGPKLTATVSQFGASVALSGNGNTALIGGPNDAGQGAAWIFTRSGTTWSQQGDKLTGTGPVGNSRFGSSVALTSDGNTGLIGGIGDDGSTGAVWTFTRSGATWTQQGAKVTGSGTAGTSIFGISVAVSADAKTAIVGGSGDSSLKGAAWAFTAAAPSVSSVSPASGPLTGNRLVTIKGANFTGATGVKIGSAAATLSKVVSDTEITAVAPAGRAGTVAVTVIGPNGTSATTGAARFTYTAAPNPIVARIVYATVVGRGAERKLDVRIRVSTPGRAQLALRLRGVTKLARSFPIKGGPNGLKAPLAPGLAKGTYQLRITLTDRKGHRRVYSTTVLVPA